jgi:hypothetical protein
MLLDSEIKLLLVVNWKFVKVDRGQVIVSQCLASWTRAENFPCVVVPTCMPLLRVLDHEAHSSSLQRLEPPF